MPDLLPLVLDFESPFDGDFTLKKMPTAQYVRDERFDVLGAGVRVGGGKPTWLEPEPLRGFLAQVPWERTMMIAHNCVPADTEVLTPSGWESIAHIYPGQHIMQWAPDSGGMEFASVRAIKRGLADTMYEWDTTFHAGAYTPDHRVYFQTPNTADRWRVETAAQVASRGPNNTYIPVSGTYLGGSADLTPAEARLMEACRADGSFQGRVSFRFALKKPRKIQRLLSLLDSLGVAYRRGERPDGTQLVFLYTNPTLQRIAAFLTPEKRYTVRSMLSLSFAARCAVLDEMRYWDGHDRGCAPAFAWSCADSETVEAVQVMAHLSGWRFSGGWRRNNRGYGEHLPYSIIFVATLRPAVRAKLVEPAKKTQCRMPVFCVTVPSGAFLVRRKGRVWVTGNCQFDGLVLNEYYGYRPKQYACTMFMLRWLISQGLVDPRMRTNLAEAAVLVDMEKGNLEEALAEGYLGEYATDDAAICGALFDKYWQLLPEDEQGYIDLHVRMAAEPVLDLDTDALRRLADADKALEGLFPLVRKDDLFAAALTSLGVNPQYKTTAKGNLKLALAKTDAFMQSLQAHDNPLVRTLAEVRLSSRSTINRSRAQRFLDVGAPLPAPILYLGAHTGRGSGLDKLNVQNLPRKGGLRETIRAPEGYKLVIVDSSQIEVRVDAWLAGQEDLLEDFRQGRDPYLSFAAYRYGQDYDDLLARYKADDPEVATWRQICKAAVLALGFMQGEGGFSGYCQTFNVPLADGEAGDIVRSYRAKYGNHVTLANRALAEIRQTGAQQAPNGTKLTYPDLRIEADGSPAWRRPVIFAKSVNEGWGNIWRGAAVENLVQKVARDVVFWQVLQLHRAGFRVVLMAHDEGVFLAKAEDAEATLEAGLLAFRTPPPWAEGLPLGAEGHITDCYTK